MIYTYSQRCKSWSADLLLGCLTCRKRKVKCDEQKPHCARCVRLQRVCIWSEEVRAQQRALLSPTSQLELMAPISPISMTNSPTFDFGSPSRLEFIYQYPGLDRQAVQYMHHFISFCCRFIAYPNDNEGNPFQEKLVPLASSSPALLHAMTAVSAGHLARTNPYHGVQATEHYALALRALSKTLTDPELVKSDSALGACLLLCVYEVCESRFFIEIHSLMRADNTLRELCVASSLVRRQGYHTFSWGTQKFRISDEILFSS